MVNHPNRSKNKNADGVPSVQEIKQARHAAGLTQAESAQLVHTGRRSWEQWETDSSNLKYHRRMHPAFFELYLLKSKQDALHKHFFGD